jgi:acylphosphatase
VVLNEEELRLSQPFRKITSTFCSRSQKITPESFHTGEDIRIENEAQDHSRRPKVHDVGYRVFLLKNAMNTALPGLSTYNWEADGRQQVIALVEGDEARIKAFLKKIEMDRLELAQVTEVTSEPY